MCEQGWNWAQVGWGYSDQFVGMGGREGTSPTMTIYEWDCSSFLGITTGCQTNVNYQHSIAPGYAWTVTYGDTSHQRYAYNGNVGANATISLAEKDPPVNPPGCGEDSAPAARCCTVTSPPCTGGWVCESLAGDQGMDFCYPPGTN